MRHRILFALALLPFLVVLSGCFGTRPATRRASSSLDFLFPGGTIAASAPSEVRLTLPVRAGLAFAPTRSAVIDPFTEEQKQMLLNKVAGAFKARKGIGRIEVVPSTYLQVGGSFTNLDQIRALLGVDLMVLVSYDQTQFTDSTRASWTYLTVVGPLLIEGEKNDVRTVMDAAVYDIPSRTLLFRAAGASTVKGRSSPFNVDYRRRVLAGTGFTKATTDLIGSLNIALAQFEEQAQNGTVQGPGTPALAMYNAEGERLQPSSSGGGGALGGVELAAVALLGLAMARRRGHLR